ncbi:MAG: IstB domain protein ATP-binding protein [Betaproteobacteria bacterium]|nr:IstB domain protein ATP-binding protein [Betaproteobacteria bacterium]
MQADNGMPACDKGLRGSITSGEAACGFAAGEDARASAAPETDARAFAAPDSDARAFAAPDNDACAFAAPDNDACAFAAPDSDARASAPETDARTFATPETDARTFAAPGNDARSSAAPGNGAHASAAPDNDARSPATPETDGRASAAPDNDACASAAPDNDACAFAAPDSDAHASAAPDNDARSPAAPGNDARASGASGTRAAIAAFAVRLAAWRAARPRETRQARPASASSADADAPAGTDPSAAPLVPEQGQCETHGAYPLNQLDPDGTLRWHAPGCPACRRVGAAEALMQRAAIAPRFEHCRFDNYIATTEAQHQVVRQCMRYAHEFPAMLEGGVCLVLRGAPGTGKNHLATAIARRVILQGHTVLNATAHEIVVRVREAWKGNESASGPRLTEREVIAEFAAFDLLIIDEVGRSYRNREGTDPVELFNVIDARYRRLKPTLLISNLEGAAIAQAIGTAAYDRLREGGGEVLNFEWDSHRITKTET